MAFTVADIKQAVWSYLDESPVDSDIIIAVNEALGTLRDRALSYVETPQEAVVGTWYALPVGLISIAEVAKSTGETYRYWRERGGKITFSDAGTFTIVHTVIPTLVDALTDSVSVHDAFRPAICHYVEGWLKKQDDDESADGLRLLQQAEAEFEAVAISLRGGRRSSRRVRVER